MKRMELPTTQT